jgi:Coenzyme PQQ synthesis protein D (PqqD)
MLDEAAWRSRFSLVAIDEEGVLLDRVSGGVFRMNHTACAIWAAFLAGESIAAVATTVAKRFGVPLERVEHDVRATLGELPDHLPPVAAGRRPTSMCRWQETPTGYAFLDHDVVTCEVDREGVTLRVPTGARPTEGEARARIRSVVPRLLALRGIHLLHASAVELSGSLLVITGPSGAGKTTSARAFARTGARLVSEDLLVFEPASPGSRAITTGEAMIRAWVAEQSAKLAGRPDEPIDCRDLIRCVEGPRVGISAIWIIDAARRAGDQIQLEQLRPVDALVALMESVYFASSDAQTWDDRFESLRHLTTSAAPSQATIPDGLGPLEAAVELFLQSEMIAS